MLGQIRFKHVGLKHYQSALESMKQFTLNRKETTWDEIWFLQHHAVFTQGISSPDSTESSQTIMSVNSDRGGKMTYHGPGQLIIYFLLDLKRRGLGPKRLVECVEQCVINLLYSYHIYACRKKKAPGVYVNNKKIASLGFRIKKGCCYHGLSLNVDMDLTPFSQIHLCGDKKMDVTQINEYKKIHLDQVTQDITPILQSQFGKNL